MEIDRVDKYAVNETTKLSDHTVLSYDDPHSSINQIVVMQRCILQKLRT